jgi:hypothetical protein
MMISTLRAARNLPGCGPMADGTVRLWDGLLRERNGGGARRARA